MNSSELSPLFFGKDNPKADAFRAASTRWQRVRTRFVSNVAQLDSGKHHGLESARRIRQFIERRISASRQDGWVDKACNALASPRLKTEVAATTAKPRNPKAKPKKDNRPKDSDAGELLTTAFGVAPVAISLTPQAEKAARLGAWVKEASDNDVRKLGEEALIGNNDTVSVEFFERALTASRPVGQILVAGEARGTGFFVGEGLLITNHHVIQDQELAGMSVIIMNVEENRVGPVLPQEEFSLDPASFFLTNATLDYTLVAVRPLSERGTTTADSFGRLPLVRGKGKILKGHPTNVIHHMGGGNKVVSFREGVLVELPERGNAADFCYYTSDTDKGSSGSPVFNDTWEVVALHHHALPRLDAHGRVLTKEGKPLQLSAEEVSANPALRDQVAWEANEGTRISSLCANIAQAAIANPSMANLRSRLVATFLP
jgi:endonuclease G